MGLYDVVLVDADLDLPGFDGDREAVEWQTKSIGQPFMRTFKLTADRRLLRQEQSYRDLTPAERTAMARDRGFESWDAWEDADTLGPLPTWDRTVDETWWVDHDQHGSVEFHGLAETHHYSYEARFTEGDLDEILLLEKTPRGDLAARG